MSSFHFANVRQGRRLFGSSGISARVSPSRVDHRRTLVLLLDEFCDVRSDFDVVIGMPDDHQNVHFIAAIGLRVWRRLRGLRSQKTTKSKNKKKDRHV